MRKTTGFTLIELLITLVVAALLVAWAVPSFQAFVERTTLTSETNNWVGVLNLARSEAITRGERVTVCRSVSPNACDGSANCQCGVSQPAPADGPPNYHSGYLIFTSTGNGTPLNFLAASNELIRTGSTQTDRVTIRGNGQADNAFSFMPDGRLDPNDIDTSSSPPVTARHVICLTGSPADLDAAQNSQNSRFRAVVISETGRPRVDQHPDPDHVSNCAGTVADDVFLGE